MRPYRGKAKYNGQYIIAGEWVYGWYYYDSFKEKHFIKAVEEDDLGNITRLNDVEVIPETVGQYTGLKDKNGKEIYEKDKVKQHGAKWEGVVKWAENKSMFIVVFSEDFVMDLWRIHDLLEVIDNSKLLEGE